MSIPETASRIDVHHHLLPPAYVAAVGEKRIGELLVSGRAPVWSPQTSVDAMDRHGIALAVTSMSAPGFWCGDARDARKLACHCNDFAAEMGVRHKGRFASFATLPLPDIEGSLAEIGRALDDLGAAGIGLLTNYDGTYLGDPAFAPVFDELDRRGAAVFVHPAAGENCPCICGLPAASLEFPFDTTRTIASLLFSGTLARCPNIRFIFSHAGGTIPFLCERLARVERRPEFRDKVPDGVLATLRRLNFDIALSANRFAFASLLELVSVDHVLFGSDFPFAPEETMAATVAAMPTLGLSEPDLAAIERGNALELLPLLRTLLPSSSAQ